MQASSNTDKLPNETPIGPIDIEGAEEQPPKRKKRSRGGRKKNKNPDRVPAVKVIGKKLKRKVLQKLSQVTKNCKNYMVQKNVKHIKKAAFKKGQKEAEDEEIDTAAETEPETGAEIRTGKKMDKLEGKLESLKSLNGKSFRLCALTIARFDLGIQFDKEDYTEYAELVRTHPYMKISNP
jgi:hypothetical protein